MPSRDPLTSWDEQTMPGETVSSCPQATTNSFWWKTALGHLINVLLNIVIIYHYVNEFGKHTVLSLPYFLLHFLVWMTQPNAIVSCVYIFNCLLSIFSSIICTLKKEGLCLICKYLQFKWESLFTWNSEVQHLWWIILWDLIYT